MYLSGKCDNKREDKHTDSQPAPAQYHAPRIRPDVVSGSLLRYRCAAKPPLRRRLRSGEEHRPNSARCLPIRRDGRALHRASNAVALRVVEHWVP
jgi:hypothetical protein